MCVLSRSVPGQLPARCPVSNFGGRVARTHRPPTRLSAAAPLTPGSTTSSTVFLCCCYQYFTGSRPVVALLVLSAASITSACTRPSVKPRVLLACHRHGEPPAAFAHHGHSAASRRPASWASAAERPSSAHGTAKDARAIPAAAHGVCLDQSWSVHRVMD